MFTNYMTGEKSNEAVEYKNGRWWIKIGFAGFNSSANNWDGYATQAKAEAAIRRYQSR